MHGITGIKHGASQSEANIIKEVEVIRLPFVAFKFHNKSAIFEISQCDFL